MFDKKNMLFYENLNNYLHINIYLNYKKKLNKNRF